MKEHLIKNYFIYFITGNHPYEFIIQQSTCTVNRIFIGYPSMTGKEHRMTTTSNGTTSDSDKNTLQIISLFQKILHRLRLSSKQSF